MRGTTPVIDAADLALAEAGDSCRTGGIADFPATPGVLEVSVCRIKVPTEFAGPWVVTLDPIWNGVDQDGRVVRANTSEFWASLAWGSGAYTHTALIDWGNGARINLAGEDVHVMGRRGYPYSSYTTFRVSASITRGSAPVVVPVTYTEDLGQLGPGGSVDVPIPGFAKRVHHAIGPTTLALIRSLNFLEGTPAIPVVRDLYSFTGSSLNEFPRFPLPIPIPANAWGIRFLNASAQTMDVTLIYELAL